MNPVLPLVLIGIGGALLANFLGATKQKFIEQGGVSYWNPTEVANLRLALQKRTASANPDVQRVWNLSAGSGALAIAQAIQARGNIVLLMSDLSMMSEALPTEAAKYASVTNKGAGGIFPAVVPKL